MRPDFLSSFYDLNFYLADGDAETLLAKSLKCGEFSAWITRFDAVGSDMRESAIIADFEVPDATRSGRRSDLLHNQPIDEGCASGILSEIIQSLRVAQIWEQAFQKKINRFGVGFRLSIYHQIDAVTSPGFGNAPFSHHPDIEKLRALDWFCAVLARLLRNWHKSHMHLARWEENYRIDARAIKWATCDVTEIRALGGATRKQEPFPWSQDQRCEITISVDGNGSVLGGSVLARIINMESVRQAAEAVAYLMFREFLVRVAAGSVSVGFCKYCNRVYLIKRKRHTFCCEACHKSNASNTYMRRRYLARAIAAVSSLKRWKKKPSKHISWRQYLEHDLFEFRQGSGKHRSRVVTEWIAAAHASPENDPVAHLMSRWFQPGVDAKERDAARDVFSTLLELIREVESIQASLLPHDKKKG